MPRIRSQKLQKLVEQEGRLLLAVKVIENGKHTSIRAAAEAFTVPRATLQDRMEGHESRVVRRHHRHKFSELQKISMEEWLLSMDSRRFALTHAMCRDMAIYYSMPVNQPPPRPLRKLARIG
jgi:allophanate hydrolase subunit 2